MDVIGSFKHKGLERLFEDGNPRGVQPNHASRILRMLDRLDASISPRDMDLPGYRLHQLQGRRAGTWATSVSGNWRLTFRFEGEYAFDVDYEDYH
jgi:proteic killer suppression protein